MALAMPQPSTSTLCKQSSCLSPRSVIFMRNSCPQVACLMWLGRAYHKIQLACPCFGLQCTQES